MRNHSLIRSLLTGSEAVKLLNTLDIQTEIQPEACRSKTIPTVTSYGITADVSEEHPVGVTVSLPNVHIPIDTSADTAGVNR